MEVYIYGHIVKDTKKDILNACGKKRCGMNSNVGNVIAGTHLPELVKEKQMGRTKEDVRITDTMIEAACLYDDGYSAQEIADKLHRKRDYIVWCLGIMDVKVDERKYHPETISGRKFSDHWNDAVFPYKWEAVTKLVLGGMKG